MIDINQQMNQIKEMISGLIPGLSDGLRGSIKNIDKSKLPKEFQNIDFDLWEETVKLQDQFNENTVQDLKQKKLDWWMAIIDEWNEILNSYNWKWWKDTDKFGEVDFNVKLLTFIARNEIVLHVFNHYGFYVGSFYPRETNVSGTVNGYSQTS